MEKNFNRLKVVLAEKNRSNKWLATELGKDQATVSKWCTNTNQPGVEMLYKIANVLDVPVADLLQPVEKVAMNIKQKDELDQE